MPARSAPSPRASRPTFVSSLGLGLAAALALGLPSWSLPARAQGATGASNGASPAPILTQTLGTLPATTTATGITAAGSGIDAPTQAAAVATLVRQHGEAARPRAARGVAQAARLWRPADGTPQAFQAFVAEQFVPEGPMLDTFFTRLETNMEALGGHLDAINEVFAAPEDLVYPPPDLRPPADPLFAGLDIGAHATDDLFAQKIAFAVLLNFPDSTLAQRLADGPTWSRRQWAEARLTEGFADRPPASVRQDIARAVSHAEAYVADYNLYMHLVLGPGGERLFPKGMRLLSHWNLRDQIKADYAEGEKGLARQRVMVRVMQAIVAETIPQAVIDNPALDWNPYTDTVTPAPPATVEALPNGQAVPAAPAPSPTPSPTPGAGPTPAPVDLAAREPDTRYARLLEIFHAQAELDPYTPAEPTHIARMFDVNRQLPEARVRQMLESVIASPLAARTARLIARRLDRPLEAQDIWYAGFKPRGPYTEAQLDAITQKRYPTPAAYAADMPRMFKQLGFGERADALAANIVVEPARGSGHARGAAMRTAPARLRTRVGPDGMDYKGYNIAVHEMGHNVEQTLSLNYIDHTLLYGVPSTAFTEALAFVFQRRDLELLGLKAPTAEDRQLEALNEYWQTFEIAGVGLVDMDVWHWMYDHPDATPAALRQATLAISRGVWNRYYAPVLGVRDATLLGVYSHMIHSSLYLPDYAIGHMIAWQLEQQVQKQGAVGPVFTRAAVQGRLTPDLWMTGATGRPVGPEALLDDASRALDALGG